MKISVALAAVAFAVGTASHAADNIKAFPPADDGMTRFVINLPLVVYLLNSVEVRYRIWRASPTAKNAKPG